MSLFSDKTSVEIPADLFTKVKKHCATQGIKMTQFLEEAIIEKMIESQVK